MIRKVIASLMVCASTVAYAETFNLVEMSHSVTQAFLKAGPMARFNVGDQNIYDIKITAMKGTMTATIMSVDANGVLVEENVDMGFMGKRNIKELIDPKDGHVLERTVDGKKETPPDPDNVQILSSTPTTVTVPAGTYNCNDVRVHMKKENQDGEQWVNMDEIPVGGMLKMQTSQSGMDVVAELRSFSRAN